MVNGFGRSNVKRNSSFICKRSQQVSILIITMSVLFLIGITTAVILLESKLIVNYYLLVKDVNRIAFFSFLLSVRNREMPRQRPRLTFHILFNFNSSTTNENLQSLKYEVKSSGAFFLCYAVLYADSTKSSILVGSLSNLTLSRISKKIS